MAKMANGIGQKPQTSMIVEVVNNCLRITIPLQTATPSASGKTMVVASTHGNVVTEATVNGHPIVLGLNAYYRNR